MDEKINGYHFFFVIFAFFLLTGFVLGIVFSSEIDSFLNNTYSDSILIEKSTILKSSAKVDSLPSNTSFLDIDIPMLLTVLAKAYFLDFRYLLTAFLCGFSILAPIFSLLLILFRGAVFGYTISLLYHMIFGGFIFSAAPRTAFFCYFIFGAINIILCINLCCNASIFARGLKSSVTNETEVSGSYSIGKFVLSFFAISFIQLLATVFRYILIGFIP